MDEEKDGQDEDDEEAPEELPVHSERRAEADSDDPEHWEQLHAGFR